MADLDDGAGDDDIDTSELRAEYEEFRAKYRHRRDLEVNPVGWDRFFCPKSAANIGITDRVMYEFTPDPRNAQEIFVSLGGLHDWKGSVGSWHCVKCGGSDPPPAHVVLCPKPLRRYHNWGQLSGG